MHVGHPAAHEDAQPHHQQVFHLDARQATLEGKESAGEGRWLRVPFGAAQPGRRPGPNFSPQTNLSADETFSIFMYIQQPIMQLLLQVGHLKFPTSREITVLRGASCRASVRPGAAALRKGSLPGR